MVKKCPNQAKDQIERLFNLAEKCIRYDPNYNDNSDDEPMEDQEDDEEGWGSDYYNENQDDDDDTAWKVRKGAVKLLGALSVSCAQQI
mmetsp:Transcript_38943/g.59200  ORF Transcript_38943/g.59200 Transcript_38943/m.59200 type:complete len:88 (+) Transcript_38943:953-1216(+)